MATSTNVAGMDPVVFGLMDNGRQTSAIIDNTRIVADNAINMNTREFGRVHDNIERNALNTNNLIGKVETGIKDTIDTTSRNAMDAIERTGGAAVATTEKTGYANLVSLEHLGTQLGNQVERTGASAVSAAEKNGSANLVASERIGNQLGNALERIGGNLAVGNMDTLNAVSSGFKETLLGAERAIGDSKLFTSTQINNVEKQAGDYFAANQRNFGNVTNDLLKVENSLGRLSDQHFASGQLELLKVATMLDKNSDKNTFELAKQSAENANKSQLDMSRLELSITKQAADNYANVQIEAAKNRLGLEQKILDTGKETLLTLLKDGEGTRSLINKYNTDNLRDNYQSEKIIHAMDHHYGHHGHHGHHDHGWGHRGIREDHNVVYDYRHNYHNRGGNDRGNDRGDRGDRGGGGGDRD